MNGREIFEDARVSFGRLMTPEQLRTATVDHPGLPGPLEGWCLCGDASASMFDAIVEAGGAVRSRLAGYVGPVGGRYMVVTHQLHARQHHFLLPLYEPSVESFLRWLEHHPLRVMLGRQGETDAMVMHNRLAWPELVPLVALCQPAGTIDAATTVAETFAAVAAICGRHAIPSCYEGVVIDDISVSVILPDSESAEVVDGAPHEGAPQ